MTVKNCIVPSAWNFLSTLSHLPATPLSVKSLAPSPQSSHTHGNAAHPLCEPPAVALPQSLLSSMLNKPSALSPPSQPSCSPPQNSLQFSNYSPTSRGPKTGSTFPDVIQNSALALAQVNTHGTLRCVLPGPVDMDVPVLK